MTQPGYNQFCPVAMAAEILGARWTIILMRELCAGSTRFNDLRRGVPRMSPALLSKRLKELEQHGIVERRLTHRHPETHEYLLTKAGQDLGRVVGMIGFWGQRWIETSRSLDRADADLLMWDMRRNILRDLMPPRRVTIRFRFPELPPARGTYWLLNDPAGIADLCKIDPGFEVDLFVHADLRTMTAIWIGVDKVRAACEDGRMRLVGDRDLSDSIQSWLGLSPFAVEPKRVH